ncbi:preprotein translocase subunit SecE [Candidatus Gracilibacteria bacterium]|jgi:preprotein translocase SecE subunit|nr:preprotein translocase subunit SecE [Candidatus Gracilibacteria bacterium]
MANFIKESLAELEHVVWPTHIETKKFFQAVVGIIVAMTIFTYLLTLAFSNGLFALRGWIHEPKAADLSGSPVIEAQPLEVTTESGEKIQVQPVEVK